MLQTCAHIQLNSTYFILKYPLRNIELCVYLHKANMMAPPGGLTT